MNDLTDTLADIANPIPRDPWYPDGPVFCSQCGRPEWPCKLCEQVLLEEHQAAQAIDDETV